jgi:hypothetical protein
MATQSEVVAHAQLVGGSSTTMHSHAGGGDNSFLRYRLAGRYHSCFPDSNGTLALTINRLYAVPFITVDAKTITRQFMLLLLGHQLTAD